MAKSDLGPKSNRESVDGLEESSPNLNNSARKNGQKIPQSRCAKLVETYPNRLMAVLKANGGTMKLNRGTVRYCMGKFVNKAGKKWFNGFSLYDE